MNMEDFLDALAAATIDGNDNNARAIEVSLEERIELCEMLWRRYFLKMRMNERIMRQFKIALDLAIQNIHSGIRDIVLNKINEHLGDCDELNAQDAIKLKEITAKEKIHETL